MSTLQANPSSLRQTVSLYPFWEWRFEVSHTDTVSVRLVYGIADRDGTELALNKWYRFSGTRSKISTARGCTMEIEGSCDRQRVAELTPATSASTVHMNLHVLLDRLRHEAVGAKPPTTGPRVMIVGPNSVGKTTMARTLTAYAVKTGFQPIVVNMNPREGMLPLPGTLTAATFATMMTIESEGTGAWSGTPTSGPAEVQPKLPLVYYYGREHATDDLQLYKEVASKLAGAVTSRMSEDNDAKTAGLIIDTPGVGLVGKLGDAEMEIMAHVIEEFSVNAIIVLGSHAGSEALRKRFHGEKTTLGDVINVVSLDEKPDGVVENDQAWLLACQHAAIKEYFYGDSKTTLSAPKQMVDFDSVTIYRVPDPTDSPELRGLERLDPSPALSHWTMPVMNAKANESPESIRTASVQGFVYITDVNKDRRKISILAPASGRDPQKPLLLGSWPEQFINLVG
ncbi:hypothetical protein M406DRAFT_328258 [Cryphonectria parasitica EP155]|uniref:Polynucleotide 5'-hydroxyl-kinase GRC3 n=1 Tax=Cryphonectria parasitica (strain ATCC 38755 / EP155) TaxID=660469 RepID=A0A9P5CQF0_CRYP1|nr:uncharacterized protein M406DRAFT_328258 [Cryphonectria parasitica EP155]KAF3767163.1 hypothetical protein M406DRAFT_328258 [Cryphonectria parasitica EP155]